MIQTMRSAQFTKNANIKSADLRREVMDMTVNQMIEKLEVLKAAGLENCQVKVECGDYIEAAERVECFETNGVTWAYIRTIVKRKS